ncbi:unnamed protein product [Cylindrotheca closterium]|uniref:Uncharacterized protein n=1 Tax=Cylindrotheca closterium TaxID=2856 RepID=A0AAD2FLY0_9STRA|nr:unnamed protein product [Cylindrotheca closterium]
MLLYHSSTSAAELRHCIEDQEEVEASLVDNFGMTPFHILFSSVGTSQGELLDVLLDKYYCSCHTILNLEDANGKRPLDYLVANWTEATKYLYEQTLQRWMVDLMGCLGALFWMEAI